MRGGGGGGGGGEPRQQLWSFSRSGRDVRRRSAARSKEKIQAEVSEGINRGKKTIMEGRGPAEKRRVPVRSGPERCRAVPSEAPRGPAGSTAVFPGNKFRDQSGESETNPAEGNKSAEEEEEAQVIRLPLTGPAEPPPPLIFHRSGFGFLLIVAVLGFILFF